MREIKFRAWSNRDKCWCGAFSVHKSGFFTEMTGARIENGACNAYANWIDLSKQTEIVLMQYTGIKDKNGKEIYEGDIMRSPSGSKANAGIGVVEYVTANQFGVPMMRYWVKANEDEAWTITERDEVIGNIYENPELLK